MNRINISTRLICKVFIYSSRAWFYAGMYASVHTDVFPRTILVGLQDAKAQSNEYISINPPR
jgi:hypothetical protein